MLPSSHQPLRPVSCSRRTVSGIVSKSSRIPKPKIMAREKVTSFVHQNSERRARPFMFSRLFAALLIASVKVSVGDAFGYFIMFVF